MISARDWSLRYPASAEPVLRNLSFDIASGERVLLLGPSGCGKSSLLNALLGLIPGSISAQLDGELSCDAKRPAAVFQDPDSQLCMLSVEDEIAFGLENLNVPPGDMEGRIDSSLVCVGLAGMQRRRVDTLSGGEKQRLALASSLALQPDLLVLDEPCSNLDPDGVRQIAATLRSLFGRAGNPAGRCGTDGSETAPAGSGGCVGEADGSETTPDDAADLPGRPPTAIIVEHRIDAVLDLVTRVMVFDRYGRLRFDAVPEALFEEHADELDTMGVWHPRVIRERRSAAGACAAGAARSSTGDTLLSIEDVSFSYAGGAPVLEHINLAIHSGECVAVHGPNGSGKSTLARLVCGVLRPDRGRVLLRSGKGFREPHRVPARELPGVVGYVFQNPEHQFVRDTVADEVAFTLVKQGVDGDERAERVGSVLARLSLGDLEARNPFTLSHGQKRRLSVATMLVAGAPLIIFDEPTFGQDWGHLCELEKMFAELSEAGVALLIITHDTELAGPQREIVLHAN